MTARQYYSNWWYGIVIPLFGVLGWMVVIPLLKNPNYMDFPFSRVVFWPVGLLSLSLPFFLPCSSAVCGSTPGSSVVVMLRGHRTRGCGERLAAWLCSSVFFCRISGRRLSSRSGICIVDTVALGCSETRPSLRRSDRALFVKPGRSGRFVRSDSLSCCRNCSLLSDRRTPLETGPREEGRPVSVMVSLGSSDVVSCPHRSLRWRERW